MRSDLLHVVTCIANPVRWQSRIALYRQFEKHMLESGVCLTVVECQYGDRPFDIHPSHNVNVVHVRSKNLIWNKENLLNIGISRLPDHWKYVAWIDADIIFRRKDWAAETVHALQQYDIVQPWSDCYDLGPNGEHLHAHRSFCRIAHEGKPIAAKGPYQYPHPGYAWAATRQAIDWLGGLLEVAALGSGDHHMALSLMGLAEKSLPHGIHPNYRAAVVAWQQRAQRHIAGNIAYVPGTIEHIWHGSKVKRAYRDRWDILKNHNFDPVCDMKKNVNGVLELSCNKPQLRREIDHYFRSRDEDANSL